MTQHRSRNNTGGIVPFPYGAQGIPVPVAVPQPAFATGQAIIPLPDCAELNRRPLEANALGDRNLINLGHTVTLCPGERKIVVDLRARCTIGEMLAIAIAIDPCDDDQCVLPDNVLTFIRGHIEWGLGAVAYAATVDFQNGSIISVPAQTVSVTAEMIAVPAIGHAVDEFEIGPVRVSAGFAYGDVRMDCARLTQIVQLLEPGDRTRMRIPAFATSFAIVPIGLGSIQAEVLAFGPGSSPTYQVQGPLTNVNQYNVDNGFPLFNGARCIEFTNLNGVGAVSAFIIFGLCL